MIDKEKLQLQIDELQNLLDSQSTAYDFKKTFDEKWQQITQEVFFRRNLPGSPLDLCGRSQGLLPKGMPLALEDPFGAWHLHSFHLYRCFFRPEGILGNYSVFNETKCLLLHFGHSIWQKYNIYLKYPISIFQKTLSV